MLPPSCMPQTNQVSLLLCSWCINFSSHVYDSMSLLATALPRVCLRISTIRFASLLWLVDAAGRQRPTRDDRGKLFAAAAASYTQKGGRRTRQPLDIG